MEELRAKIETAFDNVVNARKRLLDAKEATIEAKEVLKDYETTLVLEGLIGKNEREREADLRNRSGHHRAVLVERDKAERVAALALEIALDARRNLESMLRIEELQRGD